MNKKLNQVLSAVLLTAALLVGQNSWATNISYVYFLGMSNNSQYDFQIYIPPYNEPNVIKTYSNVSHPFSCNNEQFTLDNDLHVGINGIVDFDSSAGSNTIVAGTGSLTLTFSGPSYYFTGALDEDFESEESNDPQGTDNHQLELPF